MARKQKNKKTKIQLSILAVLLLAIVGLLSANFALKGDSLKAGLFNSRKTEADCTSRGGFLVPNNYNSPKCPDGSPAETGFYNSADRRMGCCIQSTDATSANTSSECGSITVSESDACSDKRALQFQDLITRFCKSEEKDIFERYKKSACDAGCVVKGLPGGESCNVSAPVATRPAAPAAATAPAAADQATAPSGLIGSDARGTDDTSCKGCGAIYETAEAAKDAGCESPRNVCDMSDTEIKKLPKEVIKLIQQKVGTDVDGIWGPNSKAACDAFCSGEEVVDAAGTDAVEGGSGGNVSASDASADAVPAVSD